MPIGYQQEGSHMKVAKPLQLRAYDELKERIINKEFVQGTIYSETRVSQELGISRTPMRDAIHRLAQEGYLDVIPSKGFCLHEMTAEDLTDTYQIRCALEGYCAVTLAGTADSLETQRVFHTLESILRDMDAIASTTEDVEEFARYDEEFHKRIVYSLGNSVISETFDAYHYRMRMQTVASLQTEDRLRQTVIEHRAIVEAMKSGEIGATYTATLDHIGKAKTLIRLDSK